MRYFLLTLIILLSFRANSQVATYNLILFDSCTNTYEHELLYSLEREGTLYSISDSIGTIELTTVGTYKLQSSFNYINQDIIIRQGVNIDTLSTAKIQECLEPISHPNFIGYCCCSEKCDGFQQDFYNNGNLRIEGTFKAGIPTGQVKYYFEDGTLQMVKFYNRKGILKRTEEYTKID